MRHKHFSQLVAGICCIMLAAGGAVFAESDPFLSYRSISFDAEERVVIELDNTTLPPSVEFEIYCSDESAMTTPFFSSDVYWHLIDKGTYPSSSPAFVDAGSKIRTKPSDQSVSFRFYAVGNAAIDSDNDGLTDAYEHLVTRTSPLLVDTDGNSIPDAMEDFDNDNLINSDEYNRLTDPWIQDTDNDGVSDFAETNSGVYQNEFSRGSNPLDPDTDEDGLTDNLESISVLADGFETGDYSVLDWSHQGDLNWLVAMGTAKDGSFAARVSEELNDDQAAVLILTQELTAESIFSFDYKVSSESVHDVFLLFINDVLMETWSGEVDWQTYTTVLSPGVYDIKFVFQKNEENSSGNDTVWIDNVRFASGTDPNIADMDGDTLNDGEEQQYGTSPFKSDTDSDGLSDTDEIFLHGTDPRLMDTDFDGLDDLTELNLGTDPVVGDTDNDSIPDGWENSWGLNPNVADSMLDSDTDDLTNYEEYKLNSDPLFAGDPFIVYVDNEGSGGSGTQFDPYGSIQEAIDSTPYTDGFTEYPVVFKLADGIYDLALDDFMYNNGLNSLTIDNNFLYNTYFDNYRLAIIGSSPENVIIKGIRGFAGISMFYADDFPYAPIVLKNLTITNSLEALHIEGSSPAVVNCIIRDNLGDFGSAVFIRDSLAPEIINCLITRNRAIAGAGIYISDTAGYTSSPVITHSTFADNIAEQGIAIFVVNSSISSPDPLIFNSIIWETSGDDIYGVSASMIRYCDIEDGDYNGQNNNISLNPLFATPHLLNYRITANSPCRNAGHLFGFFTPDIDSELRPANSGTDMGYDEFVDVNANNLPDAWEALYGGSYTATGDNDLDGVNNLTESRYRSDPTFGDTDGDTLTDFEEIITYGTNPLADADNDGDRLYDVDEILTHGTNPHSKDSDGDRITDDWEVAYGLNPLLDDAGLDPDTDDLTNYEEFFMYTDPFNATDPYPYYVVDTVFDPFTESTTIQGAMTLINDDRGFYGYFVGKIVVLVDGDYSENVQMEPDVVIIGNPSDREAVRLLGSGFSNLITMDADAFAVFKSLTFDSGARGLFIRDSDALITNCLIKNNEFATALDGGGLYIYNAGVEIIGSTITNNRSLGYGGGAYAERATVTLRNSIFSTNKAHLSGGGLYMKDSSLSIYENSSLSGNQTVWITGGAAVSGEGGGIYISNISPVEGKLEIKNSSVQNNLGFSAGGAIYAIQTEVALENATILNNDVTDVRENDNDGYGGALYLDKTISRLKDSTFTGNETFISGGAVFGQYYYIHLDGCVFQTNICEQNGGAGLFVDANLDIVETTFKGNKTSVDKGGALNFDVGTATITDSLFETNTASGEGGALYSLGTHLTVSQSVFSGNTAISTEAAGGAIASESNVLIDITDSEFKKNTAKRFGGALYFKECNPLVANSVFTENGTTFRGGTIYLEDADLTLTNSVLKKNTASSAGAGITLFSTKDSVSGNPINPSHANITNTLFKGNVSSAVAGAIQFEEYSTANVQFCVIVDNVSYSNVGGGIYIQFPHPTTHPVNLLNTILWNNDDDLFGFDQTTVSFCNISDGDFEGIKGNLSEEPNFTNPSIDDYHLRNDSPLLKMGTAYYSTGVDVDGETRPSTSNFSLETAPRPIPQAADIGYDEFVDSDGDNLPDYWENSYVGSFDNDGDNDNDGLLNIDEYLNNTSPVDNDSDNDGLTDYDELFVYFTDPHIDADKDLDGISDKDEILIHSTNPSKPDTDDDRIPDKWEIDKGTNPLVIDSTNDGDSDFLTNYEEYFLNTDPSDPSKPIPVLSSGFGSLQLAINNAATSTPALVIISPGTYATNVTVPSGVSLYGGADPSATIISGDGGFDLIKIENATKGIVIKNLTITGGRTGIFAQNAHVMITNCSVTKNSFSGIYLNQFTGASPVSYIINCTIAYNKGILGGGLYANLVDLEVLNSNIFGNTAFEGGGMWLSSVFGSVDTIVTIANCNIVNNSASQSGGIHIDDTQIDLQIVNTNIWGNGDDLNGALSSMVSYSNIEDGDFVGENNNLSVNPQFGAAQFGRFNLLSTSPLINAGVAVLYYPNDFDGESRLSGGSVDIGADEFIDTDTDTLADYWELTYAPNLTTLSTSGDNESDTVVNSVEYQFFTDPLLADTDGDSLSDASEIASDTDPVDADMDRDGLSDGDEVNTYSTNPKSEDTDNDGLLDGFEVANGLQATIPDAFEDPDNDGLTNIEEFKLGSLPNNSLSPVTIYVNASATPPGTGTIGNPYTSLSSALNSISSGAAIISIASGTYTGTLSMKNRVALIGSSPAVVSIVPDTPSVETMTVNGISYCIFKNISFINGSRGLRGVSSTFKLDNCVFNNNVLLAATGAGVSLQLCTVEMAGCIFSSNIATSSGGGVYATQSVLSLTDCEFIKNSGVNSTSRGGGLFAENASVVTIDGTLFTSNSAGSGGGIYLNSSDLMLNNSSFTSNLGKLTGGGGIYLRSTTGGIYNTILNSNTGESRGGGVYLENSDVEIFHTVFVNNSYNAVSGGGIYVDSNSSPAIKNSIFWNNTDDIAGVTSSMISFSNIGDGEFGVINGNISADPLFVNSELGNFHLQSNSPCVDAGSTDTEVLPDIDDETRPVNLVRDMGIDEVVDSDNDTLPDYWELLYAVNLTTLNASGNNDTDTLLNSEELVRNTSPISSDTDADGLDDDDEITIHLTDPVDPDMDDDGLTDGAEIVTHLTDPQNRDTDGDFIPDQFEVNNSLNALNAADASLDPDGDFLNNLEEYFLNTNPQSASSPPTITLAPIVDDLNSEIANASTPVKIVLTPGTYDNFSGGARYSINLKSGVAIYTNSANPARITTKGEQVVLTGSGIKNVVLKNLIIEDGTRGIELKTAEVLINNCTIRRNISSLSGGGLSTSFGKVLILNSTIHNNRANRGGAIFTENTDIQIFNTQIYDNFAGFDHGGAIYYGNYLGVPLLLSQCTIYENNANKNGGGIYIKSTPVKILNSTIRGNRAYDSGGGIVGKDTYFELNRTLVTENFSANNGGGVLIDSSNPIVDHSLIIGNRVITGGGGGIYITGSSAGALIKNSVLWENGDDLFGASVSMVSHCAIEDADFSGQNGNISANPQFIDSDAENFHLKTTSPLINAGTADAVSYTDIDGEVIPFGSASEIGMDEFVDTDNDTLADVWELTYAANIGVVSQAGDTDSDTLSNIQEHNLFSNPTGSDTDGDTLSDADEFNIYHSNPIKQDTDGDGLLDQNEVNINNTDINNPDTDGDRLPDGWEVSYSLDPLDPADAEVDCDSDTLKNYEEFFFGSNPLVQGSPASVNVSGGNIQNAIDVASGLTIIHIAAGSYFTGLQLKSNIILSGASPASTKLSAGISNSALNGSDISNIIIRNITIGDTFHSGMNLTRVDHMLLYNCVLNNNLSTSNGGGATTLDAEMEFVKCTVSNNFTNGFGGGFYLQYSNASFYDCDFFNNTRYGIYALNSIVSLVDSNFHNQGTASARLRSAVYGKACEITIHGGEFFDIFSEVNGGGVSIDASSIDMRNVVFYDNNCSNNGAAFYAANSIGLLVNNVFFNNVTTRNAGAIGLFSNSKINIWFTTITQNTAALGGGIYNSSSSLSTIHNCIVWNNTDDLFAVSSAMISNSNISDGDHLGTNGNISADPLFRNTAENDYHILSTSPSKDSGSLIDPLLTGTLQDIDNESRAAIILNDIGADEFIDSDNDGLPDFWELQLAQNISPAWDNDSDLITAEDEYKALTNPFDNDTDADGLSDHDEIILYLTDPLRDGDKDGDGLTDSQEILTYFTNPTDVDTDDDLMPDKWEVDNAFDPLDSTDGMLDADNDGLKNNEEFYHGTDPSNDGDPIKVYVDANAVGGGNGTIGSPYNSIATAITSTASSLSVRVLLVIAPGTYTQAVVLKEGIALSGTDAASVRIISHSVASAGIVMNNITGTVIKNITVTDSRLGIDADNSKFIVSGCILQNNSVLPANGGGMVIENSDAVILDSIIQNNRSSNLGGGIYSDNTELILRDSIIRNNRSNSKGGGLYIEDTSLVSFQNVQIKNNSSFVGAGIYSKNAVCSLTGSVISENTSSDQGGGMFTNSGVITIANTVIVQNKSVLDGGGAYFLNNQGIIENSVIVGNTANSNLGNGLFRFNSSLTVRNTIFSNQTPNTTGFLLADVTFCNFTDNDSTFSGLNGNIAVDPLFVNPVLGDYHLNTTSLCIDAGSATSTVVVDIDGESRPENAQVDIGLDEVVDDDNDGLPTAWENRYGQNFVPTGDDDSDTLINSVEFIYGTNPLLADTDNDMLNDFVEINTYATNPLDADSDDDTLSDGAEIITYTSNPLVTDTDNDGMPDGWEALHALNLIVDDANSNFDSDILVNIEEYLLSSEPDNSSSPHVWYVDNDAVGVGTGTIGDPFKQIQSAVDNPLRPSIVQIAEGIYFENVSIVDNGGIVLYAMPSEEAVISGKITDPAVTIKNSGSLVLLKNITIERGQGGIYASGSPVIVKECIIRNSGGSGIVFDRCLGILQVVDSIITRNTSIKGGGVYSIGSAPFIANTVISKNSAQQGGGLYDDQYPEFEHLAPIITNSVIVDNVAPTAGGIYIDSFNSVIDISNTIIWNNGDDLFGAQSTMIHDSNVQDGDFVIGGVNMFSTDPGFASEFYGRYHLLASSAMIDSGSANASAVNDIHGETRPANSAVDIGIDEFIDADNDTLADAWELTYAPNLTILDSAMDSDNDGLINSDEFRYFSNPLAQDTDGDSVADASEISPYHTDPVVVDTDYDGLSDAVEIALGTDPLVSDTDNDGMSDGWESQYGLNPLSSTDGALDLDNDSISNSEEFILNSEPDNSASPQVVYIDNEGIAPGTGTQGDPFVTVSAAINASNPPYIFRLTGAFKENVVFNKNVLLLGSDNQTTSIQAASTSGTTITFNNVLFAVVRNISLKGGKQIVIAEGSTVTFDNCIISNNQTFPSEGGGIKASNSDITVTDTLIQSTRATVRGGAIYANNSSILVDKSTISATQANSSGGALYARSNSDVKINNSRILNAVGSNGGGVFVEFNSSLKLINSAFAKNSANFSGGAVYCQSSDIEISHCAFYKNTRTSGQGSTLFYLLPTSQSMTHSIIWSDDTGNTQQDIAGVDVALITYSNIEDSIGTTNNNISIDPQFAGGEYGNLHVRITSPCRDAGAPSALITTDYDGETRPEGSAVDIGLDEYIDTDADGMPDFFETGYFGNNSAIPTGDPDFDGRLNIDEYYQGKNPTVID